MNLKKRIFNARISGQPLELSLLWTPIEFEFKTRLSGKPLKFRFPFILEFKWVRTRVINNLLKFKVIKIDISQPHDLKSGQCAFRLNDSISSNGAVYSVGQRILFSRLNINGIVQVAED